MLSLEVGFWRSSINFLRILTRRRSWIFWLNLVIHSLQIFTSPPEIRYGTWWSLFLQTAQRGRLVSEQLNIDIPLEWYLTCQYSGSLAAGICKSSFIFLFSISWLQQATHSLQILIRSPATRYLTSCCVLSQTLHQRTAEGLFNCIVESLWSIWIDCCLTLHTYS